MEDKSINSCVASEMDSESTCGRRLDGCTPRPKPGDCIEFGRYPQSGISPEPIEWLVLSVEGSHALVVSKCALDRVEYNKRYKDVTWKTCTLRRWLNNRFVKTAFSVTEQRKIQRVRMINRDNPAYGSSGGSDTKDKVFCLSIDEAKKCFSGDNDRTCMPTKRAKDKGVYTWDENGACWWWLRSPGEHNYYAAGVGVDGSVDAVGIDVDFDKVCVRPAFYLNLES